MANLIKKLAASKLVWQMTGLTYPTAVRATTGRFMSKDDYLISGKDEMSVFFDISTKTRVSWNSGAVWAEICLELLAK